MAYNIDAAIELLHGFSVRARNLLIKLCGPDSPLSPGRQVRFGKAVEKLGKAAQVNGAKRANLKRGRGVDAGVVFTKVAAHQTYKIDGDAVRERYPQSLHPHLYKPVNHRETVKAEVGPLVEEK